MGNKSSKKKHNSEDLRPLCHHNNNKNTKEIVIVSNRHTLPVMSTCERLELDNNVNNKSHIKNNHNSIPIITITPPEDEKQKEEIFSQSFASLAQLKREKLKKLQKQKKIKMIKKYRDMGRNEFRRLVEENKHLI
ncbi:hypothetical protein ABK040_003404 [Willaertia magna]